jgi:hypothetical protein
MPTWANSRGPLLTCVWVLLLLVLIYGSGVGRGFVKDDVVWVRDGRIASFDDVKRLYFHTNGFFRPVVSASFAADRALHGLESRWYGITNLCLLALSTLVVAWLALTIGISPPMAAAAGAIWALNLHGINMAVLWLSGRTGLLLTLFAVLAAVALVRQRPLVTGAAVLAALCAKEEAVLLPLVLSAWAWILDGDAVASERGRSVARLVWPAWVSLAVYFWIRSMTDAMTPATSPWFYRFVTDPARLSVNALHYIDRACTFAAVVVVIAMLVTGRAPRATAAVRRTAVLGGVWMLGAYAITVFLPVRSSLYACLPSVGAALVAAVALDDVWARSAAPARRRLIVCATMLSVAMLPVYWARNVRWTEMADLSSETFVVLKDVIKAEPDVSSMTFVDDRSTRRSFANTFGALLPEAVRLATGRAIAVRLEPPMDDEGPQKAHVPSPNDVRIELRQGRLTWVRLTAAAGGLALPRGVEDGLIEGREFDRYASRHRRRLEN